MTTDNYVCPNGCKPDTDTPFYYGSCCLPYACEQKVSENHLHGPECEEYELGVLVRKDLSISNRWVDGVVGVPQDVIDYLEDHDCLPNCIWCHEEIIKVKRRRKND